MERGENIWAQRAVFVVFWGGKGRKKVSLRVGQFAESEEDEGMRWQKKKESGPEMYVQDRKKKKSKWGNDTLYEGKSSHKRRDFSVECGNFKEAARLTIGERS